MKIKYLIVGITILSMFATPVMAVPTPTESSYAVEDGSYLVDYAK